MNALVTGASRGIGRAVAERLAAEGFGLGLSGRDAGLLAEVAAGCGAGARVLPGDLCDVSVIGAITAEMERAMPPDVLVHAAGVGYLAPCEDLGLGQFDEMIGVNLRAAFLLAKALLPGMRARGRGHLVFISSIAGTTAVPGGAGYCASKWGLMGLCEVLRADLRGTGLRVTTICPGSVATGRRGREADWMLQAEDVADMVRYAVQAPERLIVNEVRMRPAVPGAR